MSLPTNPTIETLFNLGRLQFGFSEDRVRQILKGYGKTGFRASEWHQYVMLLRQVYEDEQALAEMPVTCPICSSPVERDRARDNMFGVHMGWKCISDPEHFLQVRLKKIKPMIVNRPDPKWLIDDRPVEETFNLHEGEL